MVNLEEVPFSLKFEEKWLKPLEILPLTDKIPKERWYLCYV